MGDKELEIEESLGPDDPGSIAYKLAHPGETPPEKTEEELEAARLAEEAAVQEATVKPGDQTGGEPPEPPKPKYSTVEEYEKAYKEAETKMHTATQEAAEARKAREALEAEIALTRKELDEVRAAQEAAVAADAAKVPKANRKAIVSEVFKKVKEIPLSRDPDTGEVVYPDDYDDRVADAWASTVVDPAEVAKEAARLAREELKRERQAEDSRSAAEQEEAERLKIVAEAEGLAAAQGLDMTPGAGDYRLFYSYVNELAGNPEHEYRGKPFEEQVKWAINGVRLSWEKKIEMTDAERAAARRHQDRNAVLERGVTRMTPAEPPKQRTMQEILDQKALA